MAEGLAKQLFGDSAWIESAGSLPKNVNSTAIRVMKEIGIDISHHRSKNIDQLSTDFIQGLTHVITLCADEVCPIMLARNATRAHWPLQDPATVGSNDEERLASFREVRDELKRRLESFHTKNAASKPSAKT